MNRLTITQHKSKYSAGHYPTFAIDELPLEVWLPHHNPQAELHLVAAHSGLYSDQENELIWGPCLLNCPRLDNVAAIAGVLRRSGPELQCDRNRTVLG